MALPPGSGFCRQNSVYFSVREDIPEQRREPPAVVVVDPPPVAGPGTLREQAIAALVEAAERLEHARILLCLGDDPAEDRQSAGANHLPVPCGVCQHCGVRKRAVPYNIPGTDWTSWYTPRWCSCESTQATEDDEDCEPGPPLYAYLKVRDFDVL